MSDPGPACLSWLPLLHRIANAEAVIHYGLRCSACRSENFRGLKYKSDRSPNYQLCQACFWCGHISSEHKTDVFKEYNSHKPCTSSSGRSTTPSSLKKSMNCLQGIPNTSTNTTSSASKKSSKKNKFPSEHSEKPMDLSNMMPPTSVSSGTLWSHPGSSNFGPSNMTVRSSGSSVTNPISEQHYFLPAGPQGEIYDDPYMVSKN